MDSENYARICNLRSELKTNDYDIVDVGLGLLHTLVYIEKRKRSSESTCAAIPESH